MRIHTIAGLAGALVLVSIGVPALAGGLLRSGTKLSSEVHYSPNYETEVADDFVPASTATVIGVTVWGGPFDAVPPPGIFTLRFYADAGGCVPASSPSNVYQQAPPPVFAYLDPLDGFPINSYSFVTNVPVTAGTTYWVAVEAEDSFFGWGVELVPPTLCEAAFRSAYWGFPAWIPESVVRRDGHDIHMEIEYGDIVPVRPSSWGTIKSVYR